MGLDMHVYAIKCKEPLPETKTWETLNKMGVKMPSEDVIVRSPPENNDEMDLLQIFYWRKHRHLHGWMENLWKNKLAMSREEADQQVFNCEEVLITKEDLKNLEEAVKNGLLPETTGFFFGYGDAKERREEDLEFIERARKFIDAGFQIYYSSWW